MRWIKPTTQNKFELLVIEFSVVVAESGPQHILWALKHTLFHETLNNVIYQVLPSQLLVHPLSADDDFSLKLAWTVAGDMHSPKECWTFNRVSHAVIIKTQNICYVNKSVLCSFLLFVLELWWLVEQLTLNPQQISERPKSAELC